MGASLTAKGLLTTAYDKWTNGIVYYVIDNNSFSKSILTLIFSLFQMKTKNIYYHLNKKNFKIKSCLRIANNLRWYENDWRSNEVCLKKIII